MKSFSSACGAAAAVLLGMAMPGQASVVDVDTIYTKAEGSGWTYSGFGRTTWISQSFTAGVSGSLDRMDLQIVRFGADDLRFRFGSGEAIAGTYVQMLAFDVAAADVPTTEGGLFGVDLASHGLRLEAGQIYSVILSSTLAGQGGQFGWVIGEVTPDNMQITAPPYAGGQAFASVDQGLSWQSRGVDRPLRTWMTAAVPEPATWAMFIAGFGVVGAAARRRGRAAQE
jgi:hypothetical protein